MFLIFSHVVLLLLCKSIRTASIEDQIAQLAIDDQEKILHLLQSRRMSRDVILDQAENWCCKSDPGVQATSQTRIISTYVVRHGRHKCGYDSCGFLGWSKCTRWCDEYWREEQTSLDTYLVYTQRLCPKDQLVCCAQHIYVLGHCFSYEEIYHNQEALAHLNDLGIVIPGPSMG